MLKVFGVATSSHYNEVQKSNPPNPDYPKLMLKSCLPTCPCRNTLAISIIQDGPPNKGYASIQEYFLC